MLPHARAGPHFHACISSGKFHGNDLADDADRFVPRVAEVLALDGDGLAVDLVGPAGVVAVGLDGQRQVGVERIAVGLAVVERFEGGQLFLVLLDEVGELVEQPAAFGGAHLRPGAFLEGLAGGLDGEIDVGLVALGDLADGLAGGGVEGGEGLAGDAVEPFAADEQRLLLVPDLGERLGFQVLVFLRRSVSFLRQ